MRQKFFSVLVISMLMILLGNQVFPKSKDTSLKDKQEAAIMYQEAQTLYNKLDSKSLKLANIKLENALELDPKNVKVLARLSILYSHFTYRDWHFGVRHSDYITKATELAYRALKIDNKNPLAIKAVGASLLVVWKRKEAIKELKKLTVKKAFSDPEVFYLLACASNGSMLNRSTEAGKYAKKALELDPKFLWLIEDMLMLSIYKKDLTTAARYFKTLEENYPTIPNIYFYRAMILLHKGGLLPEVKKNLKRFTKEDPNSNLSGYIQQFIK